MTNVPMKTEKNRYCPSFPTMKGIRFVGKAEAFAGT